MVKLEANIKNIMRPDISVDADGTAEQVIFEAVACIIVLVESLIAENAKAEEQIISIFKKEVDSMIDCFKNETEMFTV